jgi:hypothetical protein
MKTILFVALVCILSIATSFATAQNGCSAVQTPQGTVDFSNGVALAAFFTGLRQTGVSPGTYPFYFSLCDTSIVVGGGKACPPGSYISQGTGTSAGCAVIFPTVKATYFDTNTGNVRMNYTSTSNQLSWLASMNCKCDSTATSLQVPSGQYVANQLPSGLITLDFDVVSAGCCVTPPSSGPSGITWGGVFLIIFFVPSGIYVIAMVAWNYKNEKRGRDLAPHPEFWGSLPGLAKDGITFIWAKIRGQPWSPSEGGASSSSAAGEGAGNYTPV